MSEKQKKKLGFKGKKKKDLNRNQPEWMISIGEVCTTHREESKRVSGEESKESERF